MLPPKLHNQSRPSQLLPRVGSTFRTLALTEGHAVTVDARPSVYLPPTTQRAECERAIRRLRAVQRACRILDDQHGYVCAGDKLDVALAIWRRLDELVRLDTREA